MYADIITLATLAFFWAETVEYVPHFHLKSSLFLSSFFAAFLVSLFADKKAASVERELTRLGCASVPGVLMSFAILFGNKSRNDPAHVTYSRYVYNISILVYNMRLSVVKFAFFIFENLTS